MSIQARHLRKTFGDFVALDDVSLDVPGGELVALLGPSGSGKTTLLRLAAGLLAPTCGSRECAGRALYLRGGSGLRTAQTVSAAVASAASLVGRAAAAGEALDLLGARALAGRRVGTLSAGERVRVALAAAVACDPVLLCLDEPTAVLDDRALADLVAVLHVLRARGTALLVATHQPGALLAGADAHLVVAGGRITPHPGAPG
jgi:ABC-type multidrug transport system ATPase subunit